MSLQLVSMLIYATEEVCSTMYIEHDPFAFFPGRFSLSMISLHLDPFSLQCTAFSSPLPPLLPSNLIDPVVAQLNNDRLRGFKYAVLGYRDFVDFDPARRGHPLRSKALYILDPVMGGIVEKLTDKVYAFMVRDMSRRLLAKGLSVQILLLLVRTLLP